MKRRSVFLIQLEILKTIKQEEGITMSSLEIKIRTNPYYLREYCGYLEFFNLIKIKKEPNTQKVFLTKNGVEIARKNCH